MKTERKRMIAMLLSMMMVLTMIPSMAFAGAVTEENVKNADGSNGGIDAFDYDESDAESVTVTVTLANDGIPLQGNDEKETDIAHLEVTVPYFDLALYGLGGEDAVIDYYRYHADDSGTYMTEEGVVKRPTVLHLYIYLLERYYLGLPKSLCGQGNDVSKVMDYNKDTTVSYYNGEEAYSSGDTYSAIYPTGFAQSIYMQNFFGHDENLMYYRNHKYPLWRGGTGSTADYMLLSDGDDIDIAMFSNWDFWWGGSFLSFGKEIYKAASSDTLTVETYSTTTSAVNAGDDAPIEPCDGTLYPYIYLYDSSWDKVIAEIDNGITDNEDGTYEVTLPDEAGTYYLVAVDGNGGTNLAACAPATAKVIVGNPSGGSEPETPVDDLAQNRIDANNQLDTYVDKAKYREAQQAEIEQIITAAKETIATAESADAITQAVASAKAAIDAIKTDAQLKQEEAAATAAKNIANKTITGIAAEYIYTGKAITPAVSIAGLKAGTDFTVTYSNNINVGTATVTIKGIGNYNGTTTRTFKIVKPLPKEGTVVKDTGNAAKYEVTESERGGVEVAYTAPVNKKKTTVTIPATVKLADGTVAEVTSIDAKAFKNNKKIKKVTIGKNVEEIGKEAFTGATKLTTVKLGAEVETIGTKAFSGCKKLKTVSMGKNVETIGSNAFAKCTSLKSVTLPADVEKIGAKAFYGDKKLKKITIKSKKLKSSKVGKKAFKGVYSKAKVNVPNNKVKAYKKFFYKKGLSKKAKIS